MAKTHRVFTLQDARDEQHAHDEAMIARDRKRTIPANLHPAIGVLMTARGPKFYAYVDGHYTEGTAEQLTAKIAVRA